MLVSQALDHPRSGHPPRSYLQGQRGASSTDVEHEGFGIRRYRVPASEFGLVVGELDGAGAAVLPGEGPRIALCLEGAVILGARGGTLALRRGQSAFVPHADGGLVGSGTGVVVVAFVPPSEQVTGSGRGPVTRRVAQPSGAVD